MATKFHLRSYDIPTRPKRTQYNAANIGKGIDAKTAPNFPCYDGRKRKTENLSGTLLFSYC
jgi:hypothetical protein